MNASLVSTRTLALVTVLTAILIAGCKTRSISDSGYQDDNRRHSHRHADPGYKGELSEFEVLGVNLSSNITDAEIVRTLDTATKVRLRKGANLMVIQSGAYVPDAPVTSELNKYFNVVPFSGQPQNAGNPGYSKTLRLAAAQAACESVVCYWGTLESARATHGTKAVSWVPIIGYLVPDETQHMRIRLKFAVVDVRTGNWSVFTPEAFENRALSGTYDRASSDQSQVEKLKRLGYQAAVNDLLKLYTN